MFPALTLALLAALPQAPQRQPQPQPPQPAYEIALKTNALARGMQVSIGELADISPTDADALTIGSVVFGPAPVAGFARTVTRTDVLRSLVAAGYGAGTFRFRGASETLVQSVTVPVSPASLVDAATTVLQAVLAQEGGDVELEPQGVVRNLQVQPGHRSQELRARVRGAETQPGSAVVDVDVLVDGEVAKTVPVQFKLTRFQQVLKVAATVRAGAPLGPENVAVTRERLSQSTGLFLTSFDQIAGMIARRNLQPNQLLTLGDVGQPAIIRRGEVVTVIVTRGRVKVTATAVANHDAGRGEPVTCTNPRTRAQVTGIAEASGTVVVPTK
ncbi:MAG: flagellar basal body P-ring formation chaperone FlgA [Planctomycetota bacterium]